MIPPADSSYASVTERERERKKRASKGPLESSGGGSDIESWGGGSIRRQSSDWQSLHANRLKLLNLDLIFVDNIIIINQQLIMLLLLLFCASRCSKKKKKMDSYREMVRVTFADIPHSCGERSSTSLDAAEQTTMTMTMTSSWSSEVVVLLRCCC